MTNRYSRALKQLKNKSIDEKLELLSEIPTNNSGGFYVDVPGVYTTLPITNPVGEAGTPVNLNQDGDGVEGYAGADTTGLFKEDGTVLTVIPPGDNSYILGPMISMWYAWANYTQIGYVRQSDRKMVNLGRITGELDNWDGESGFTGYGQMSLEQAVWYKGQSRQDYRAFYPGPPSNPADEYGRYIGSIISGSRFPNTFRQPSVAHTPGTQRGFDPSNDFASLLKKKELEDKNRADEIARTVLNAAMLGLDIVAVLAVLFPEPASSAAGAAILGSKLRYVAKFAQAINKFNPFRGSTGLARGLRGSQVGATGLKKGGFEALKGGKNLHKGSKGLLSPGGKGVYSSPKVGQVGPGGLKPGTGASRYTQAGSNPLGGAQGAAGQPGGVVGSITPGGARGISSIEPQKVVNPQTFQKGQQLFQKIQSGKFPRSSRANQYRQQATKAGFGIGKSNVPSSNLPKQFRGNTKTFSNSYEYDTNKILLEQINKMKLLETATAVPSLSGGGTDVVDGYVDKVSETSSPEQLEKASNDANNIAKEGGKGLSDADLAKIDKDAEAEAKRLTNFDVSNPESMNADQLSASTEMMYEIDPDWLMESFGRNESLIDTVKLDKLYNTYSERRSYIGSLEHGFSISPEFKRYYNQAEYLHNTYVSQIHFGTDGNGYTQFTNKNTGEILGGSDLLVKKLREWSGLFTKTWDTFNSKTVRDRVNKDREENDNNYRKQSDILFRPFYIQIVREWSQRGADINDDPFSIKDYINQEGGIQNMSEADKKRLKAYLSKMGVSYGDIAYAAAGDGITGGLAELIIGSGIAVIGALGSLYNMTNDQVQNIYKSYNQPGIGDAVRKGDAREKGTSEAEKQEKAEAAQQLQDAEAEIKDAEASGNQDRLDRAHDNYTKARNNRTRVGQKWKTNRKNQKESYEPQFLKNREIKNVTEIVTPKQKRILREIKKPFEIKEAPTKFKVKPTGRNNKVVGVDMMKIPEIPNQFKPPAPSIWSAKDREKNIRASQEKKNEVLELVGAAEHHWTYLTEKKRKEDQEKVNEMMSIEFDKHLELMYENHKIKEERMNKAIKAVKRSNDLAPDYPENPPPQLDPETGMHPKYGKKYKHDKLDPHSAEAMPPTGNPEIDANVKKATDAKAKARKLKILLGKKS